MKKSILTLAVISIGLFVLAAACQQSEKGKSFSKWHLEPAPSPAAGYGAPPLQQEPPGKTPPASPGYDKDAGRQGNAAASEKLPPSAGGYGPTPAAPTWRIEPPPSAAGYGK
jgi:hypothetical protein